MKPISNLIRVLSPIAIAVTLGVSVTRAGDGVDELPAAVEAALEELVPGFRIKEAEGTRKGGRMVFEIKGFGDGAKFEVKIAADGEVLKSEIEGGGDEDDDDDSENENDDVPDELPQEVTDAIAAEFPTFEILEVEEEDGLFEIDGTADGKEVELKIQPDGTFVKIEIEGQEGDDDSEDDANDAAAPEDGSTFPEAVVTALEELASGLRIKELEVEHKNGTTLYKIHGFVNGGEAEIKIWADGTVLESEFQGGESETDFTPGALPEAVLATLQESAPDLAIREIEFNGRYYEIEGDLDKKKVELKILADGTLLKIKVEGSDADENNEGEDDHISADDLPEAVKNALQGAAPDIQISEITRKIRGELKFYEIEGTEIGKGVELEISELGEVLKFEMDSDSDGLGDADESDIGSDPNDPDSDHDNFPDGFEVEKGVDPLDAGASPQILNIFLIRTGGSKKVKLEIETFDGRAFGLEHCPDGITWEDLGVSIVGDGAVHQILIPVEGFEDCGFFRIKLHGLEKNGGVNRGTPGEGGSGGKDDGGPGKPGDPNHSTTKPCEMPENLEGLMIKLDDESEDEMKQIAFDEDGDGRDIETEGNEIEFTPFSYTVEETGNCMVEITITYPGQNEDDVVVYEMQFSDGNKGVLRRKGADDESANSFTYQEPEIPESEADPHN